MNIDLIIIVIIILIIITLFFKYFLSFESFNNNNTNDEYNQNCYAYAISHPKTKNKLQPGEIAGLKKLKKKNYSCQKLINRVLLDNAGKIYIENYGSCMPNYRKIALFLDKDGKKRDYHFYRQEENRYWTHKRGDLEISSRDDSGNLIISPLHIDRDYRKNNKEESGNNYKDFCAAFCIKK